MSHELGSAGGLLPTISLGAGCPVLAGLVPGQSYLVEDLSQGASLILANYDVIATAIAPDELAQTVTVIVPGALVDDNGWFGLMDWADCLLYSVIDHNNNHVNGKTNIQNFPFLEDLINNNFIDSEANVSIGTGTIVTDNHFTGDATVTIAASGNLIVTGNFVNSGTLSLGVPSGPLVVLYNNITSRGVLQTSIGVPPVSGSIRENTISSSGSLTYGGGGPNTLIQYNIIDTNATVIYEATLGAAVDITGMEYNAWHNNASFNVAPVVGNDLIIDGNQFNGGTYLITNNKRRILLRQNIFQQNASLVWTDSDGGNVTIQFSTIGGVVTLRAIVLNAIVLIDNSEIFGNINHTANDEADTLGDRIIRTLVAPGSNITTSSNTGVSGPDLSISDTSLIGEASIQTVAGGVLDRGVIENGTLVLAGFTATNIRLQGANSTLVANVADAENNGYTNALP